MNGIEVIPVTTADITAGVSHACKRCPVALALRRFYPLGMVGKSRLFIDNSDFGYEFDPNLYAWVSSFDSTRGEYAADLNAFTVEIDHAEKTATLRRAA